MHAYRSSFKPLRSRPGEGKHQVCEIGKHKTHEQAARRRELGAGSLGHMEELAEHLDEGAFGQRQEQHKHGR